MTSDSSKENFAHSLFNYIGSNKGRSIWSESFVVRIHQTKATPKILFNFGLLYHMGQVGRLPSGEPDYEKAATYYKQSQTPKAKFNLALLYFKKIVQEKLSEKIPTIINLLQSALLGGVTEAEKYLPLVENLLESEGEETPPETEPSLPQTQVEKEKDSSEALKEKISAVSTTSLSILPSQVHAITPPKKPKMTRQERLETLKRQIAEEKALKMSALEEAKEFKVTFLAPEVENQFKNYINSSDLGAKKTQEIIQDIPR